MNSAKWVALRWCIGFLAVCAGLVYFSQVRSQKMSQIINLQNRNNQLVNDVHMLNRAVGSLRHDLDRLKADIQVKEEMQRQAQAAADTRE